MQLSSVVLPQPEAPSATTKSPSCMRQVDRRQRLQRAALDGVVDRQAADVERGHGHPSESKVQKKGGPLPAAAPSAAVGRMPAYLAIAFLT
jgi:hypothetical protein